MKEKEPIAANTDYGKDEDTAEVFVFYTQEYFVSTRQYFVNLFSQDFNIHWVYKVSYIRIL